MTTKTIRTFWVTLALLALAACSGAQRVQAQNRQVPAQQPQLIQAQQPVTAQQPQAMGFAQWLAAFKSEAMAKGITKPVLDNAFAGISGPLPDVVQRDQTQPEKTITFDGYMRGFLKQKKIDAAREQWDSHTDILKQVEEAYGVPAPVLLALWQTESRFGQNQGSFNVVESLATLAYDGRRSKFFRKELLDALLILQQEQMPASALVGSWAGAMGQVQFMPSSYLSFAVDFDGDGKKDIWNSDADALASMANYLSQRGWNSGIGWGIHVRMPRHNDGTEWVDSKEKHTFRQWQRLGIRRANGAKLPKGAYVTRLVMPDSDPDNAYLVTSNYDVIMDWNHSVYFATAVGLLSDAIAKSQ